MTKSGKKLFWGMGVTFVVASLYPISILINLGVDGVRWIQNDLAYSFFVLLILPLAVGIFTSTFKLETVESLPKKQSTLLWVLLAIMLLFAVLLASQEVLRGPSVPPIMLKEPEAAMKADQCLRDCMHAIRAENAAVCGQNGCPESLKLLADTAEPAEGKAVQIYQAATKEPLSFNTYGDVLTHGSMTAYVSFFFDVFSGVFVMLVLWYILVLATSKAERTHATNDNLIVVYGLLLLWFPTRVYSEWYMNFYSVAHFKEYYAFWFLLVVALVAIPLFVLLLKPGRPVAIFTTLNGVVIALFGLANHFKPAWVRATAYGLENMPFLYFVAFVLLISVLLGAMVFAMLPGQSKST